MKKKLIAAMITIVLIIGWTKAVSGNSISIDGLDKVTIKYELKDGTVKEVVQNNKNPGSGQFEKAVINLLDYYYNTYNVKRIISINDVALSETQFASYSGQISDSKKGMGYSTSEDMLSRAQLNNDIKLVLVENNPDIPKITVNGVNAKCTGEVYKKGEHTFIPLRSVFEAMGFSVTAEINSYYKVITATKVVDKKTQRIEVRADSLQAYGGNNALVMLKSAIETQNGITYITLEDVQTLTNTSITVTGNEISIKTKK